MYKLFYFALTVFWIFDIINIPFMEMFDAVYPVNTFAWLLIWIFIPSYEQT